MFEAMVRGEWLRDAAGAEDIERATRDEFPRDFNRLVAELEQGGHVTGGTLSLLKTQWWARLCSLTHTGLHQIRARLTPAGIGYKYTDAEVIDALRWANTVMLGTVAAFAEITSNPSLMKEVQDWVSSNPGWERNPQSGTE